MSKQKQGRNQSANKPRNAGYEADDGREDEIEEEVEEEDKIEAEEYFGVIKFDLPSSQYPIIAKESRDNNWIRLTPNTNYEITALCSSGFASCFAMIVKSANNRYISLIHCDDGEEGDRAAAVEEEMERLTKLGAKNLRL